MDKTPQIADKAVEFLKQLISIPSYSRDETKTADLIFNYLVENDHKPARKLNNVWVFAGTFNYDKPTLLLNSHHDTVQSSPKWIFDPFTATEVDGKLYGLGSNDAGGPLTSLLHVFLELAERQQPYNLIFLASAEEEISGIRGVPIVLEELGPIDLGIVGEPTSMEMAVAERGLIVLDCTAHGKSGHAARGEGENAIYKAIKDIEWFRNYEFGQKSELLGGVNMTVTQIEAGRQHNVVPDECRFVVDVRPNELYSNAEILNTIEKNVGSEVRPRSLHLNASSINLNHPVVKKGRELGIKMVGSQTMSDQVHMSFPCVKIGPGDTHRSHTADEYIYLREIEDGINMYLKLLDGLKFDKNIQAI